MDVKSHLVAFGVVLLAFIASTSIVVAVIDPIQHTYFPEITPFATLLFLPHGVRVIVTWLYGVWSIPYLFFATIFADLLIRGSADPTVIFITAIVCYASFELFKLCGLDMYKMKNMKSKNLWRSLLLIAFVSSVFNSILHNIVLQSQILPENALQIMLSYMVGDVLGTLALFFIVLLIVKAIGLTKVKINF